MSMYRQYEDPRALENELVELKAHAQALLFKARQEGELSSKWDELSDLGREISELEDRINFAWQDEEYDEDTRDIDLANNAAFMEVYE